MWQTAIFWYELSFRSCVCTMSSRSAGNTLEFGDSWLNQAHWVGVCLSADRYFCQCAAGFVRQRTGKQWVLGFPSIRVGQVSGCKVDDVSFGGDGEALALFSFPAEWRKVCSGFCGCWLSLRSGGTWEPAPPQLIVSSGITVVVQALWSLGPVWGWLGLAREERVLSDGCFFL